MKNRIHMKDQQTNRVREIMNESLQMDWDEIFQNAVTFSLVSLFMALGLSWQ